MGIVLGLKLDPWVGQLIQGYVLYELSAFLVFTSLENMRHYISKENFNNAHHCVKTHAKKLQFNENTKTQRVHSPGTDVSHCRFKHVLALVCPVVRVCLCRSICVPLRNFGLSSDTISKEYENKNRHAMTSPINPTWLTGNLVESPKISSNSIQQCFPRQY